MKATFFATQDEFTLENLEEIVNYKGLQLQQKPIHWKNLFCLFERKGEL